MQYYCKDSNCTQKVQFFHVSCTHIVHNILHEFYDFLQTILLTMPVYDWMILTTLVETFSSV